MYDIRLEVNGLAYGGFRSGEFRLSLEQMCNDFSLDYADVWQQRGERCPIQEGNRCKLTVDGNVMIDGWVDEANVEYVRALNDPPYGWSTIGQKTMRRMIAKRDRALRGRK